MKYVLITIFCCFISSIVHAWGESCSQYSVHINNVGTSDCVLKKYYILYGKLETGSKIPDVIFRNKETAFHMTAADGAAACLLTYECGYDRSITFFTTTTMGSSYNKTRSGIIEAKNITAQFEANPCNSFSSLPHEITWTLDP